MIEFDPLKWDLAPLNAPIPPMLPQAIGYEPKCPARYWSFWYEGFSDGNWSAGGAAADAYAFLTWLRHPAVGLSQVRTLILGDDDERVPHHKIVVDLAGTTPALGLPSWWGEADLVDEFLRQQHLRPPELEEPEPWTPEDGGALLEDVRTMLQAEYTPVTVTTEELAQYLRAKEARIGAITAWLNATGAFKAAQSAMAAIRRREGA